MKSKKERIGKDTNTRVATTQPVAPPKTPIASKLRKDAQAKTLAAEKVATSGEMEVGVLNKETEEVEKKIKKKKRTIEEEEEDERETAELTALIKEQDNENYEDAALDAEESDIGSERMSPMFIGDPRRAKEGWLKAWTRTYDIPAASLSLFARSTLIPPCRGVTTAGEEEANEILIVGI
jgi:hypothetical protein